jgi:hypothetical protein
MSRSFPLMKYFIYFSRPYTTLPPLKMLTWHWKFYCTRALLQIPRWSRKTMSNSFYESKGSFVLNRVEYLIIYMYTASSVIDVFVVFRYCIISLLQRLSSNFHSVRKAKLRFT